MDINILRQIGNKLIKEVSSIKQSPDHKNALGYGASGDRTFLIDRMAEEIILSGLEALKEPLTIISEETGTIDINGGGRIVVVDPIDGSKNAITGIPFYCASIAVADGDSIESITSSYIINLVTGDEFWAQRGTGAYYNSDRMHVQHDDTFYLVAYEAQVPGRDIPKIIKLISASRKTRCLGAIALELAYLAYGAISVFVSPAPSRSFDFAGGWLIVKESGGVITDTEGNDLDKIRLGLKQSAPIVASGNTTLHQKALKLIGEGN
jgi:myo-inositol-1(or 4)-monophosphatase